MMNSSDGRPSREQTAAFFAKHLVNRGDQALTPHDWAGMAELFADDAEYFDSTYGLHRGKPSIRKFLHDSIVGMGAWRFPIQWLEIGEGRVVVGLSNRAPGRRADGTHHEFPSVTVVEYNAEGQIVRQMDMYDRLAAVRTYMASKLAGARSILGGRKQIP